MRKYSYTIESKEKERNKIMKKSNFVAMILGTIGGILFALGMCMALISEWNAFRPGVIMGAAGAVVLLIMVLVWRKMENKIVRKNHWDGSVRDCRRIAAGSGDVPVYGME